MLLLALLNPNKFKIENTTRWMAQHWHSSIYLSIVYALMIYFGQKCMQRKKPMHLKTPLIVWNVLLAIFSVIGVIATVPEFWRTLIDAGFDASICQAGESYIGTTGYFVWLFVLSKAVELGDTAFLVLRKRPVIFLHWFHHISVMVYAFYGYQFNVSNGRWGVAMNFSVHSVMYSYYAVRACGFKVPIVVSMFVTLLQITQMAVGAYICLAVFYKVVWLQVDINTSCQVPISVSIFQTSVYCIYLYLFAQFFYNSYIIKRKKHNIREN